MGRGCDSDRQPSRAQGYASDPSEAWKGVTRSNTQAVVHAPCAGSVGWAHALEPGGCSDRDDRGSERPEGKLVDAPLRGTRRFVRKITTMGALAAAMR